MTCLSLSGYLTVMNWDIPYEKKNPMTRPSL